VCGIVREDAREEERVGDVEQSEGKIVGEKSGKQVEIVVLRGERRGSRSCGGEEDESYNGLIINELILNHTPK